MSQVTWQFQVTVLQVPQVPQLDRVSEWQSRGARCKGHDAAFPKQNIVKGRMSHTVVVNKLTKDAPTFFPVLFDGRAANGVRALIRTMFSAMLVPLQNSVNLVSPSPAKQGDGALLRTSGLFCATQGEVPLYLCLALQKLVWPCFLDWAAPHLSLPPVHKHALHGRLHVFPFCFVLRQWLCHLHL